MDARMFQRIKQGALKKRSLESSSLPVQDSQPVDERSGMVGKGLEVSTPAEDTTLARKKEESQKVLGELEDDIIYLLGLAAESNEAAATSNNRLGALQVELEESKDQVKSLEEALEEERGTVRHLSKCAVQSAVKIGGASAQLVEVRKTRNKVFATAQEQIADAQRECAEAIEKVKAEYAGRLKWQQEEIDVLNSNGKWMWEELVVARNRLRSLQPSEIYNTLMETEHERDELREKLELTERRLRKERRRTYFEDQRSEQRRRRELMAMRRLEGEIKKGEINYKALRKDRDDVAQHNQDLLSKISVVESQINVIKQDAALRIKKAEKEAEAKVRFFEAELDKMIKAAEASSSADAKVLYEALQRRLCEMQHHGVRMYQKGFQECRILALQACPEVDPYLKVPLEAEIQGFFQVGEPSGTGRSTADPIDLND